MAATSLLLATATVLASYRSTAALVLLSATVVTDTQHVTVPHGLFTTPHKVTPVLRTVVTTCSAVPRLVLLSLGPAASTWILEGDARIGAAGLYSGLYDFVSEFTHSYGQ